MNNTETRLELYDGSQWYDIPMSQDIPISINLSIADVREPDKVKASGSKTVTIPFSKEANKFFEFIFQANINLQTFNPNLKTPAKYYIGGKKVFEGDLQLIKINLRTHGTVTDGTYECNIVGNEGGIFIDMGDIKLEDLDYSDLNHAFTLTADDKFTPAVVGSGYAYGFVDYGFGDIQNETWKFTDLKCGIFEREYLSRIFSYFGYTWDSDFLDSAFYKRLWIPDVNEGHMKQSQTEIDNAQFYAGLDTYQTGWSTMGGAWIPNTFWNGQNLVQGGYYQYGTPPAGIDPLFNGVYNNETTYPWFDNGGVYNNVSMIFTTNLTSGYTIAAYNKFRLYIDTSAMTITSGGSPVSITDFTGSCNVEVFVCIQEFINGGWNNTLAQQVSNVSITNLGNYDTEVFVSTPTILIPSGRLIRTYVYARATSTLKFYNAGISPTTPIDPNASPVYTVTGVPTLVFDAYNGNYFYGKITDSTLQYGQTVDVGQTVPREVKCKDFFKSIIQRFNLRVEPDQYDDHKLIIEPYETFYTTAAGIDWTNKIDVSQPMEWRPMGELEGRTYVFTYKEDKDVYNQDYQDKYKEAYGTERIDINNEFIKGEKKNELIFSNTPIVGNIKNTMAVPKLYALNGSTAKSLKCNIRSIYWAGLINTTPFYFDVNGTTTVRTTYPYVGFVNNPAAPTLDLSFDNPYKLYWALPGQTFTNNNLYNLYWKNFIDEVTDMNSKILTAKFRLNPQDIESWTFRHVVFVIDAYYIVNKIMDYNPLEVSTCTVELLKLKNVELFTPDNNVIILQPWGEAGNAGLGALPGGGYSPSGNGGGGVVVTGNYDRAGGSIILGNGNRVY